MMVIWKMCIRANRDNWWLACSSTTSVCSHANYMLHTLHWTCIAWGIRLASVVPCAPEMCVKYTNHNIRIGLILTYSSVYSFFMCLQVTVQISVSCPTSWHMYSLNFSRLSKTNQVTCRRWRAKGHFLRRQKMELLHWLHYSRFMLLTFLSRKGHLISGQLCDTISSTEWCHWNS